MMVQRSYLQPLPKVLILSSEIFLGIKNNIMDTYPISRKHDRIQKLDENVEAVTNFVTEFDD